MLVDNVQSKLEKANVTSCKLTAIHFPNSLYTTWLAFAVLVYATSALRLDENIGQAPKSEWARPPLPPLKNPSGGVGTEGLNVPEPPINGPFGSQILLPRTIVQVFTMMPFLFATCIHNFHSLGKYTKGTPNNGTWDDFYCSLCRCLRACYCVNADQ